MATVTSGTEQALVTALQRGDEAAFMELVRRHHALMVRVARGYVRSQAVAEEVAQEAWLGVLNGIGTFESRATLKTWILRILVNRAKTRAEREGRTVPFSALDRAGDEDQPAVDPSRFLDASHPRWPGHWAAPPQRWDELPAITRLITPHGGHVGFHAQGERLPWYVGRIAKFLRDNAR